MSEVEARLSASRSVRIHRSAIVNIDPIKELQSWFRGDFQVLLRDGTKLTLSKSHRCKLDSQFCLARSSRPDSNHFLVPAYQGGALIGKIR